MKLFIFCVQIVFFVNAFSSYPIATGERDHERLQILNELYNPSTLSLLELKPNIRVLTIGCGIALLEVELARQIGPASSILATDVSSDQLIIAKHHAEMAGVSNLSFMQLDIDKIDSLPGQFDRIHCRFVLSHLILEKVYTAIPRLYNLLAPGGILLLEEIETLDSLACEPLNQAYEKWKDLVFTQFAIGGGDCSPGRKIKDFLHAKGYAATFSFYQPTLYTAREKSILSLGVESVKEKLLTAQAISQTEIDEIMIGLKEIENNPLVLPQYCETRQVILRRPNVL